MIWATELGRSQKIIIIKEEKRKKQQSSLKIRATTERDPHITIVNDTRGSSLKHEKYGAILKPQSLQTSLHSGKNSGIIV